MKRLPGRELVSAIFALALAFACSGDPEIYYPPGYNPDGTPITDAGASDTPAENRDAGSDIQPDADEPDGGPADVGPDAVANPVNGWTADLVLYEGGAFAQLNSTAWVENNALGRRLYEEVNRDEWTVYLIESETRRTVNLDLYDGRIYEANGTPLHEVTGTVFDSSDAFATTRFVVASDDFPESTLVQIGLIEWEARTPGFAAYSLTESTRDPHTIRLIQAADGSDALWSADFWTQTVGITGSGSDEIAELDIVEADTEGWPAPLVREVVYQGGRFVQGADYLWSWQLEDAPDRPLQSASFSAETITANYGEEDPEGGEVISYRIELATVAGQISVYRDEGLSESHAVLEIR